MNTRIELWKEYRNIIDSNISLQKSVLKSNKKLHVLYSRLKNVFPDYDKKYKTKLDKFKAFTKDIVNSPIISNVESEIILDEINIEENQNISSFSAIETLEFGAEELKEIINLIKKGNKKNLKYLNFDGDEIVMNKTQNIMLGEKMNSYRIAIDGPSGSGKSTVAKEVATKYKLTYINTGLVYRAIAFNAINQNIDLENSSDIKKTLETLKIELLKNEIVNLNGKSFKGELRENKVSQGASIVASYDFVREFALNIQLNEAKRKGIIMDGRDTTFKIMPNADLKIFLDTSPEVRAKRRADQNIKLGFNSNYEEILNEIKIRDDRDRNRKIDPLHKTSDAHLIDSSNLSIKDVVNKIDILIKEKDL